LNKFFLSNLAKLVSIQKIFSPGKKKLTEKSMKKFNIEKIQSILASMELEGWLLYDFRGSNELALNLLEIPPTRHLTRRFYYYIPAKGNSVKIVNGIEAGNLDHLPGERRLYSNHDSLTSHLSSILKKNARIAMEYSPFNAIPYISKVDAGTIEQIKTFGVDIHSSADLISMLDAVWSDEQYQENIAVADALSDIVYLAFGYIKKQLLDNKIVTEHLVQQFIMNEFAERDYFTDHPPIVGVNENSANPHYSPTDTTSKKIHINDFVLIDLWAKPDKEDGVWSDITWTGYVGEEVPEKYSKIFNIVADARDSTFNFIKSRFAQGKEVRGYEADDVARNVIGNAGFGEYFIHRTGHSITTALHGTGAHLDNFETRDERLLLPSTSFSIEPGIYLPGDFGVRSEIDVFITKEKEIIATGGERQKEIYQILA
jgi:Xaa-Pro dipeptidase